MGAHPEDVAFLQARPGGTFRLRSATASRKPVACSLRRHARGLTFEPACRRIGAAAESYRLQQL